MPVRYIWTGKDNPKIRTPPLFYRPQTKFGAKVIFLHQFVILFTGGACVVAPGGGVVLFGGHLWFYSGGVHGFSRGRAWFFRGVCMVFPGGMHGFSRGACVVLLGGVQDMHSFSGGACMVFSVFSDTMRYGQWAGSTHPTGMYSCFNWNYSKMYGRKTVHISS